MGDRRVSNDRKELVETEGRQGERRTLEDSRNRTGYPMETRYYSIHHEQSYL